jgi:acyl carrier protein
MAEFSVYEIDSRIKEILVSDVYLDSPADDIGLDESLTDVHGVDSIGFLELRVQCERAFGVKIPDHGFNPVNFESVRSLSGYIRKLCDGTEE